MLKLASIFVKAVTDIKNGEKPTAEESLQRVRALEQAVTQVIDFVIGKCSLIF